MKGHRSMFLIFACLLAGGLFAEEAPRRRRRFITFTERAATVNSSVSDSAVDSIGPTEADRLIEQESSRSIQSNEPDIPGVAIQPMGPRPRMSEEMLEELEEEEEDAANWINMEDLLSQEDRDAMELVSETEELDAEMEIMDWDALQEELIDEEMTGDLEGEEGSENDLAEEMAVEMREEQRRIGQEEDAGLQMSSMLENQGFEEDGVREGSMDAGQEASLAPVLQQVLIGGEAGPRVIGDPSRTAAQEFSGSRRLLQDLQTRQTLRAENPAFSRPGTVPMDQLRDPFAGSPSLPSASPVGGFDPSFRPEPVAPVFTAPVAERPPPREREVFREEPTTRIRSRLGAEAF